MITDIDFLITEDINDKGAEALRGAPIADCDKPDYAGTVLAAAGPELIQHALDEITNAAIARRAVRANECGHSEEYMAGANMVLALITKFAADVTTKED